MTTVGYGDYYSCSNMGRMIAVIIMVWGVFVVSMFVHTLTNQLEFSPGE